MDEILKKFSDTKRPVVHALLAMRHFTDRIFAKLPDPGDAVEEVERHFMDAMEDASKNEGENVDAIFADMSSKLNLVRFSAALQNTYASLVKVPVVHQGRFLLLVLFARNMEFAEAEA